MQEQHFKIKVHNVLNFLHLVFYDCYFEHSLKKGTSSHLTFERDPILPPLAPRYQLQFAVLVEGNEGLETQPASPPHNSLLLLKQEVHLLQRAH